MREHMHDHEGIEGADASFRAFTQFNDPGLSSLATRRKRMVPESKDLFPTDRFSDRLARALADARAICLKEMLEAFELFERVRHRIRAPQVVDLCCGHGLAGMLFAVFEREVEQVTLVDYRPFDSCERVLEALTPLAPWIRDKVRYLECEIADAKPEVGSGASVIALHACGGRTDEAIEIAVNAKGALAAVPCCYRKTKPGAPRAIRRALGVPAASDIARTYRLSAAGYQVDWAAIPRAITPKNRVIVGKPPRDSV